MVRNPAWIACRVGLPLITKQTFAGLRGATGTVGVKSTSSKVRAAPIAGKLDLDEPPHPASSEIRTTAGRIEPLMAFLSGTGRWDAAPRSRRPRARSVHG